ncbi:hypothetical protein M9H77_11885 [Catharanthus roseus]|uniref:Uncharacterized protein n=1 Tax=Catharanthus roseus TaxID=4058 RepID=A0ACC0BFS3_CATRO|nr:hypothetical protein M9H77_11885 [Catharanthus roseus]
MRGFTSLLRLNCTLSNPNPKVKKISDLFILSSSLVLFSLPSPSFFATKKKGNPHDKKVLLQIKATLNLSYWIPEIDCDHWHNIKCDFNPPYRIIKFTIFSANISNQILNLTDQIPCAITKLSNLKMLRLTNLSGPVPVFLAQLKNLNFLDLSFNNLTGSIPPQLS